MIKLIIFDLDNTLIKWDDDFKFLSLKEAGIEDKVLADKINQATIDYEGKCEHLRRDEFIKYVLDLGIDVKEEVLNKLIDADKNRFSIDNDIINLLKYLKSKYKLVVATNWFVDVQKERLKNAKLLEYFDEVYTADLYKMKPSNEMYIKAMENFKPDECLMVGDSVEKDLIPAKNLGMNVILVGNNNDYKCVNKITELKEML